MEKKKKFLVASTRDWCTKAFAQRMKIVTDVVVISADRSFGDIRLWILFAPYRLFYSIFKSPYYSSYFVYLENTVFDLIISLYILIYRPSGCILLSSMSKFSLRTCNFLRIRNILFVGEEYLVTSNAKGLHNIKTCWIRRAELELFNAERIFVESSFVRESLPVFYRSKTTVIFSPIHSAFEIFDGSTKKINLNGPIKFGIVSTYYKKNTMFALRVLENISRYCDVELHVFGDKSFFENSYFENDLPFKIVLHSKVTNINSYITELSNIDAYLFPTLSDGGPRALVEIASLGSFVFSSQFCIAPDISQYFNNIYVLPLDVEKWVDSIRCHLFSDQVNKNSASCISFSDEVKRQNKMLYKFFGFQEM